MDDFLVIRVRRVRLLSHRGAIETYGLRDRDAGDVILLGRDHCLVIFVLVLLVFIIDYNHWGLLILG